MANLTPAYFFPPYLLLIALGNGILLKNAYFLTMLFLAGFFTYLLLRRYEISTLASFAGGSIFMFSGDLIQNVSSFIGQTGCCLPFALFVTRWFLDRPTLRRTAGLAFAYASISLASFPPVLVAIFGFAAVYALASVVLESPMTTQRLPTAWRYVGGALLALALVAFYYVPAFVLILSTPQARAVYETAAVTSVPLLSFYQLISPSLVGGGNIYAQPPFPERSNYSLTYIGIAAFTLAFAARTECSRKRAVLLGIAITGAVLVALKLFGIPPIQWIASLPVFKTIHFALYFGVLLQFLIAILAALGLDIVVRGRATGARGALAGAFVVAVLVSIWVFARASGALIADSAGIWIRGWERVAVLGLFATALLLAAARSKRSPIACRRVAVALILIVSVEGVTNAAYPRQRRWDVWRHPVPHVQLLAGTAAAKNGRFFNASALNANMNSAFEIFGLDSVMTFNSPRLFRYYIRYVGPENAIFLRNASLLPSEPVLDAAAISQLAIRRADESPYRAAMARGLVRELDDGNVVVFRCSSHGRFYYTTRYRLLRPEEALSEAETRASWDDEIDVEERPSFPSGSPPRPAPEVRIDEFRRNRYVLSVTAPVPCNGVKTMRNDFASRSTLRSTTIVSSRFM